MVFLRYFKLSLNFNVFALSSRSYARGRISNIHRSEWNEQEEDRYKNFPGDPTASHPRNDVQREKRGGYPANFMSVGENLEQNEKKFMTIFRAMNVRSYRERKQKIMLEGKRLIETAVDCGFVPDTVFHSQEEELPSSVSHNSENVEVLLVSSRVLRNLTKLSEPPKVVAVGQRPKVDENFLSKPAIPVTVLCSSVRDPDNLGSIVAIANAVGCKSIMLMKGCMDVWDRKVLKIAEGAHFRIPIINNIDWADIYNHILPNSTVYVADSGADIDVVDTQVYADVGYIGANADVGYIEANADVGYIEANISKHSDDALVVNSNAVPAEVQTMNDFSGKLYCDVSFPRTDIVVYVGGETEGIDPRMREVISKYGGVSLKLPLENEMDSLNVCTALTIILYEIRRQLNVKRAYQM